MLTAEQRAEQLVIQHFGVKGMKWGVRKDDKGGSSKKTKEVSSDAAEADAARVKAKKQGPQSLSNKEMQSLVNRMNLEQQYSKLAAQNPKAMMSGANFAKKLVADTAKDVLKNQTKWVANYYAKELIGEKLNIPTGKDGKVKEPKPKKVNIDERLKGHY